MGNLFEVDKKGSGGGGGGGSGSTPTTISLVTGEALTGGLLVAIEDSKWYHATSQNSLRDFSVAMASADIAIDEAVGYNLIEHDEEVIVQSLSPLVIGQMTYLGELGDATQDLAEITSGSVVEIGLAIAVNKVKWSVNHVVTM